MGSHKVSKKSRRSRSLSRDKSKHRSSSSHSRSDPSKDQSRKQRSSSHHKEKTKHKKSKSKRPDESSSDSEMSDSNVALLQKLERERLKQKIFSKDEKEKVKSLETPEEKRLRRLLKKEAKERKRKEKMGWDDEYLHFTNEDNPYGDSNLLDHFVWKKKLEKDGQNNLSKEELIKKSRDRREQNKQELEKVKKRRLEREQERAERERQSELEQREKEAAQFSEFSKQEDVFQLEQARIRSQIRIQDGRAKPIDLLAQYVSSERDVTAVDMHEPYTHLTGLTLGDLEDLLEDIKVYQQLEKVDANQTYWFDLTTIVQDELRRLRQRDATAIEDATTHRSGIHASISQDVSKIFLNKSVSQLKSLQANIEAKLAGPTKGIDVGYWESLLSQLRAHQARASLRERHKLNLKQKLQMLKEEQGVKEEYEEPVATTSSLPPEPEESPEEKPEFEDALPKTDTEDPVTWSINAYEMGGFSPKLFTVEDLEPGIIILDEEEEEQRLKYARRKRSSKNAKPESSLSAEEKNMQKEAQHAMSSDEVQFSVEARLDTKHYLWSDKYRPRKPRYFNRVHTGFEWNKYNQTHYDMENPPPKIVQGYKFNIFYPDLIDKANAPQYELIPIKGNKDFALLKFTAGPPYEDIGFKIVNREWEYSYKRGFRCQFHNNILQLWFHFKRYRYRR